MKKAQASTAEVQSALELILSKFVDNNDKFDNDQICSALKELLPNGYRANVLQKDQKGCSFEIECKYKC